MQKILFVAHCLLNTASKVEREPKEGAKQEEELRLAVLRKALDKGVQLIQLPCPEFTLYGACRWGHVYEQFDNAFFRAHSRKILTPIVLEMKEYLAHPEKFEVLGIIGIDGSPSCGVSYTCRGKWGGELSRRDDLQGIIHTVHLAENSGVFIEVLQELLSEAELDLPLVGLFAPERERVLSILDFP
jgi:predicted secreted protein